MKVGSKSSGYSNWKQNPSPGDDAHCVQVLGVVDGFNWRGKWNASMCHDNVGSICERLPKVTG